MARRWFVALALAVILGRGAAPAADPGVPKVATDGIHWGGMIAGPDITPEAVSGRVLILEFWGVQCPPCAQTMPLLEQLHRTLGPQGLLVVGVHTQGNGDDEVRQAAAALGVSFPIVGNSGVEGLEGIPQLPYTLLFDHTGKCVFHGSALGVGGPATAAVAAAPPALLGGRALVKLTALYPLLKNEASFGTALKKARGQVAAKDEETAEEATFVVEKIEAWARDVVDNASEARRADPQAALGRLQRCATAFKGSPVATDAMKLVVEWKKDPAFRGEIKSCEALAGLESLRSRALGGARVATPDLVAAAPPAVKSQMKELADFIGKTAPGSKMSERAGEIALEFGLGAGQQP